MRRGHYLTVPHQVDLATQATFRTVAKYLLDKGIDYPSALTGFRLALIRDALERVGANAPRKDVAKLLGTSRNVVYYGFRELLALPPEEKGAIRMAGMRKEKLCAACLLERPPSPQGGLRDLVETRTREIIIDALRRARGNKTYAAQLLRIKPHTLRVRIQKLRAAAALPADAEKGTHVTDAPLPACRWCGGPIPWGRKVLCSDECRRNFDRVRSTARRVRRRDENPT